MDIEIINNPKEVQQGTDEWFSLRLGKLTGSRFPAIMPSAKQKDLPFNKTQLTILKELAVERMTGIRTDFYVSEHMAWGTETESVAREYYELENFCIVKEVGFYPFDDFGDSPDGIIEGVKAIEFKCPKSTTHLDYMLEPKKLLNTYKWQCYGHMIATGLKECDLVSFDPRFKNESQKMVVVNIQYEQEEADKLIARLKLAEAKIKEFCNA